MSNGKRLLTLNDDRERLSLEKAVRPLKIDPLFLVIPA